MSAYRFCRTDDIGLLVDALNRCWAPHFPDEPLMTAARFKRSIRDLQVWCSSCMVAFAGSAPIGVLIGAKRSSATLIQQIAVHPDHLRQGHGRHLLTSLSSKLAILGPPHIVAEVPDRFVAPRALFGACGYFEEERLTDYVYEGGHSRSSEAAVSRDRLIIPVTVDDLMANDLLARDETHTCWARSTQTLVARKDDISGLAVASDERIEAYVLYTREGEILAVRAFVEEAEASLKPLLPLLGPGTFKLPKVHPAEISNELLETLGFRTGGAHLLYRTTARSD